MPARCFFQGPTPPNQFSLEQDSSSRTLAKGKWHVSMEGVCGNDPEVVDDKEGVAEYASVLLRLLATCRVLCCRHLHRWEGLSPYVLP